MNNDLYSNMISRHSDLVARDGRLKFGVNCVVTCGIGWYGIVDEFLHDLRDLARTTGFKIEIHEIRNRNGELSFMWSSPNELLKAECEAVGEIWASYARMSRSICAHCAQHIEGQDRLGCLCPSTTERRTKVPAGRGRDE